MCSRDLLIRRRENVTSRRGGDIPQRFFGVLFGTYKRRHRDVLMGRRGYVPLRRLGNVPLRRRWVFHLRLV